MLYLKDGMLSYSLANILPSGAMEITAKQVAGLAIDSGMEPYFAEAKTDDQMRAELYKILCERYGLPG